MPPSAATALQALTDHGRLQAQDLGDTDPVDARLVKAIRVPVHSRR